MRPTTIKIFHVTNILLLSLVAGVWWGRWLGPSRSIDTLTPQTFLEVSHTMIPNFSSAMPVLMPAALISTLPVLYLLYRVRSMRAFYFTLTGSLIFAGTLLIALLVNVPIDRQIQQWTLNTLPENWEHIRDRWEFFNTLRTFASLSGLAFIVWGSLLPRPTRDAATR